MGLADTVSKKGEAGVDQGGHLVLAISTWYQGGAVLLPTWTKKLFFSSPTTVSAAISIKFTMPGHLVVLVHPQQIASQAAAVGFIPDW